MVITRQIMPRKNKETGELFILFPHEVYVGKYTMAYRNKSDFYGTIFIESLAVSCKVPVEEVSELLKEIKQSSKKEFNFEVVEKRNNYRYAKSYENRKQYK